MEWRERLVVLWESSTVTTSVVTLLIVLTVCVLYVQEKVVPPELFTIFGAMIGFWLRGKTIETAVRVALRKGK